MKTTELFNFPFVDRIYERDAINNFFNIKRKRLYGLKDQAALGKQHFLIICMRTGINIHCVI